jgi:hypothetical protein
MQTLHNLNGALRHGLTALEKDEDPSVKELFVAVLAIVIERVVERRNRSAALKRVNRMTAHAGVDGMTTARAVQP